MAAEVNYFQIDSAQYFVPVSVRMPGSELVRGVSGGDANVEIDMIGEIKDDQGVTQRNVRDLIRLPVSKEADQASPIQYEIGFTLLPGSYSIKLLSRNGVTGRIGTFESQFQVPNLERETGEVPVSSVVMSQQRSLASRTIYSVKQTGPEDGNPLVKGGRRLLPAVGRTFSAARPLYVFLQVYERDTLTPRPIVSYLTCYQGERQVLETPPTEPSGWDDNTRAVSIQFVITPGTLGAGAQTCQVTVIDPIKQRVAFRRVELAVK
jgi:hypothetical protein